MSYGYIGKKPTNTWKNNSGVLSISEQSKLTEEKKITKDYGLEFIAKGSFNNKTLEFVLPEKYRHIMIVFKDIELGGGVQRLTYRYKLENHTAFDDTEYSDFNYLLTNLGGVPINRSQQSGPYGRFGLQSANTPGKSHFGMAWLMDVNQTNRMKNLQSIAIGQYNSSYPAYFSHGAGYLYANGGDELDAASERIREILFASNGTGTVIAGDILLYGFEEVHIPTQNIFEKEA